MIHSQALATILQIIALHFATLRTYRLALLIARFQDQPKIHDYDTDGSV
jgi:hypothetical protein